MAVLIKITGLESMILLQGRSGVPLKELGGLVGNEMNIR